MTKPYFSEMPQDVVEQTVRNILQTLDDRFPAGFNIVKQNCVSYRTVPLWPKFLIPHITPYILKKDTISISDCLEVYYNMETIKDLQSHKMSNTLAILGSGSSINELSDDDYSFISSVDSLALNWWGVYNDFIPDFYKFELGKEIRHKWTNAINDKSSEYKDTIFIYEPERMFNEGENAAETLLDLNDPIRKNMVDIRLFQYYQHNSKDFNHKILKSLFPTSLRDRILHYRGSLSQALAIAYLMDYKHIILFGVDLNHSGYFFSNKSNSHKTTDQGKSKNSRHSTAETKSTKGIHEYIKYVNDNILDPEEKSLYIGSKNSLLYPGLEYYKTHPSN